MPLGEEIGPYFGGRLTGIVPANDDPNKLIVCGPGGGLWKTTNNGKTWEDLPLGLNDQTVYP